MKTTTETQLTMIVNSTSATHFQEFYPEENLSSEEYYERLKERQRRHLESVKRRINGPFRSCLHDSCQSCHGTGIKIDGSVCIHFLHCTCPRCSPQCASTRASDNTIQIIM